LRIPIRASRKSVFDCWNTQKGIESWFLREARYTSSNGSSREGTEVIEPGDQYVWRWHGHADEVEEKGSILSLIPNEMIRFSFGKAGDVTVRLLEHEDLILAELTQENIPLDDDSKTRFHVGCSNGWTFYLANLKSILEGGKDLRNRDVRLQQVISS
jgi:uncharacterized protein YndB with AHSA1/START domain